VAKPVPGNFPAFFSLYFDWFHQQWTDVLWGSRDIASNTIAYCNEFTGVIMPFIANQTGTLCPISTAIEILQEYESEASDLEADSKAIGTAFQTLHGGLTNFNISYSDFASNQTTEDNNDILTLQTDITNLQQDISVYVNSATLKVSLTKSF
jgi:hypothetical protein